MFAIDRVVVFVIFILVVLVVGILLRILAQREGQHVFQAVRPGGLFAIMVELTKRSPSPSVIWMAHRYRQS